MSAPAFAQSAAPIRIGPGGSTYQTAEDTQSVMARQTARITNLEAELSRLTGRIEELEFRLSASERAREEITQDYLSLNERIAALNERLNTTENSVLQGTPRPSFQSNAPQVPSSDPRELMGSSTGSVSNSVDESPSFGFNTEDDVRLERDSAGRLPEGSLGSLPASRLPGDAGALYETGRNRLLNFDYAGAEVAFRAFLDEFGEDPQAGEVHYWLGEVLYQEGDYAGSASFLTSFVRDFPDDPRRADGVVKLARALVETGDTQRACGFLGRIEQVDPNVSDRTLQAANVQSQLAGCN